MNPVASKQQGRRNRTILAEHERKLNILKNVADLHATATQTHESRLAALEALKDAPFSQRWRWLLRGSR